jgi:Leucine-rich repeat (LRR) protein
MANLLIGEGIAPQHNIPGTQLVPLNPPLPGQTTIENLPTEMLLEIFRKLPPSTPPNDYRATCHIFDDCYQVTIPPVVREANALLLMNEQTRALERCAIPCSKSIRTYEQAVNLVENTKKIILLANQYLPEDLKFTCSADELIVNCDKLHTFLRQADDYNLGNALYFNTSSPHYRGPLIPYLENGTHTERASTLRAWIKTEEAQRITSLFLVARDLFWLPIELCQLRNLERLFVTSNHISSVPADIGNLKKLRFLGLENNLLSSVPPEFGQLKKLTYVYLRYNHFVSLPNAFKTLPKSVTIYMANNGVAPQTPGMEEIHCEISFEEEE